MEPGEGSAKSPRRSGSGWRERASCTTHSGHVRMMEKRGGGGDGVAIRWDAKGYTAPKRQGSVADSPSLNSCDGCAGGVEVLEVMFGVGGRRLPERTREPRTWRFEVNTSPRSAGGDRLGKAAAAAWSRARSPEAGPLLGGSGVSVGRAGVSSCQASQANCPDSVNVLWTVSLDIR